MKGRCGKVESQRLGMPNALADRFCPMWLRVCDLHGFSRAWTTRGLMRDE
jgi:hypothetical protein